MTIPSSYIVCGNRPWNQIVFERVIRSYPGDWHFITNRVDLTTALIDRFQPRYVFFLHWSDVVSNEILERCECINFHMADVPYGRGGTPLQNLILASHRETRLAALRMTKELDSGPVYFKESMSLEGNAEEIYIRQSELAAGMIARIIAEEPTPIPQSGTPVVFKRRKPADSVIPTDLPSLQAAYDFIRMLDAEGYPKAFLTHGQFRLEFTRVGFYNGRLVADVTITTNEERSE